VTIGITGLPYDDPRPDENGETTDQPPEPEPEPEDTPPPAVDRRWAIGALAANIGVLLFCSPVFGIIGSALAGIGLSRITARPASARMFVRWAWIVVGVSVILVTLLNIWYLTTQEDASNLTVLAGPRYA
jgi:hypothetical protein